MSSKKLQEHTSSLALPIALLLDESMEPLAVDGETTAGGELSKARLISLLGRNDWSALGSFLNRMEPERAAVRCLLGDHEARCQMLQDLNGSRRLYYVRLVSRAENPEREAPGPEADDAVALSFARSLAHDLRSPLSAINMCLSLIQQRYGEKLDERTKEHLHRAKGVLDRTGALIQEHLEQYLSAGSHWEMEATDMNQIACEAVEQLEALVAEQDAHVEVDDLPVVSGNPLRLRQLMQNLIENAVRHGKQGAPEVRVAAEPDDEEWVFFVRDNGPGFDQKVAEQLFEPGYSEDGSGKHGHGLGLTLAKEIVEEHGGRIWARSTRGEGSTFYFSLPAAESAGD